MSKNSNKSSDSSVDMSVLNLQPKYKIADQSTTMNKTPGNNSTSRSSFTVASNLSLFDYPHSDCI